MDKFTFDLKNIAEGDGIAVSLTGMLIVFVALSMIALFIKVLPWALKKLSFLFPKVEDTHGLPPRPLAADTPDDRLIAAIGFALFTEQAHEQAREHD